MNCNIFLSTTRAVSLFSNFVLQNAKDTLLDEINSANSMLFDTFISIANDNGTDGISSSCGGTMVKLFYTATSLAPDLASLFATPGGMVFLPSSLLPILRHIA